MAIVSSVKRALASALRGTNATSGDLYQLFRYVDDDGTFDYQAYVASQTAANRAKIAKVWASEENIAFLSRYLVERSRSISFGICHGTRRGLEQQWFRKHLGCDVIGTEISETAAQFPHTIQWDFHEERADWIGTADFVYSNSFDHCYDPKKCIRAWISALKPSGRLFIEHSRDHIAARRSDPFGVALEALPYLVLRWSNGEFSVREILQAPGTTGVDSNAHAISILVIMKN